MNRIRGAQRIQVVGHVRPDGDCIGALLAMHHLLGRWGIEHALAAAAMPISAYDELTGFERIAERPAGWRPDLVVFVDTADLARGLPGWTPGAPIVNIDHHAGNTRFGEINWIEPACSSVCEMLFWLARRAAARIDCDLAEALLLGLMTDTGSFRFNNTGATQLRVAAELVEAGARPDRIARLAWGSQTFEGLSLLGTVLSRIRLLCGGRLSWSELRRADYARVGGEQHAPENLADQLRAVRGVRLGLLFHELPDGAMRINYRSDGAVNVSALATALGGGGHPAAAGAYLTGADYEAVRDRAIADARQALEAALGEAPGASEPTGG
ncbi:MAG TPA: DHH family phosphoesterase [Candidatus Sumerlaeota bacterium]|nr:DHH family phosphoesterase [Candidatus Sumerlaeota bacterium]